MCMSFAYFFSHVIGKPTEEIVVWIIIQSSNSENLQKSCCGRSWAILEKYWRPRGLRQGLDLPGGERWSQVTATGAARAFWCFSTKSCLIIFPQRGKFGPFSAEIYFFTASVQVFCRPTVSPRTFGFNPRKNVQDSGYSKHNMKGDGQVPLLW